MAHPRMTRGDIAEIKAAAEARRRRPKRIRRTRGPGAMPLPHGAIYVGRPTRWGNPYRVGEGELAWSGVIKGPSAGRYGEPESWVSQAPLVGGLTQAQAVELYRWDLTAALEIHTVMHPEDRERTHELRAALGTLAGHDLACWCALEAPCHADVLLELANERGWQ